MPPKRQPPLWKVPRLWPERRVWLLGGGPSLRQRAGVNPRTKKPDTVFSVLSNYLTPVHSERVIAVNQAFRLGQWVDVCFFGDRQWHKWNAERLRHWGGLLVSCADERLVSRRVMYLGRSRKLGLERRNNMVAWQKNSGASAINLAYHFGAASVVLVGFDGEPQGHTKNKRHHWHNDYPDMGPKFSPYGKWGQTFNRIQADAEKLGLEIINANPDSAIEAFPKAELEDLW